MTCTVHRKDSGRIFLIITIFGRIPKLFYKFSVSVAEHLTAQHSAIKMLHSRVKLVLQYVRAVQVGELPRNHEILREANSLSHRLPVLQSPRFRADFYNVSNKFDGTSSGYIKIL